MSFPSWFKFEFLVVRVLDFCNSELSVFTSCCFNFLRSISVLSAIFSLLNVWQFFGVLRTRDTNLPNTEAILWILNHLQKRGKNNKEKNKNRFFFLFRFWILSQKIFHGLADACIEICSEIWKSRVLVGQDFNFDFPLPPELMSLIRIQKLSGF